MPNIIVSYVKNKISASTCTCDLAAGTYPIGQSVTITLHYQQYYIASSAPQLIYREYFPYALGNVLYTEYFTQVDEKTWTLTTSFNPMEFTQDVAGQIESNISKANCKIITTITNCTSSPDAGEHRASGITVFTLTCDPRYEFSFIPNLTYRSGAREYTLEYEKVSDTVYELAFTPSGGYNYTIYAECLKKTIITDKYGTITAYKVTKDDLATISRRRWVEISFDPQTYNGATVYHVMNEKYIDTAKYVVSLFKLFMDVEPGDEENVYFGPYDMQLQCPTLPTDFMILDFGTVTLTGRYGNSIDYKNTTIDLYLPFIGFVTLAPSDYMDREVGLKYQVNVLNGEALAILTADGEIIETHTGSLAMTIPFQLGANEYQSTELSANPNYIENSPPFINVKTARAVIPSEALPYRDTKFYARFGDLSGYTEAEEIDFVVLSPHITKTEIEEIKELISNGVFLPDPGPGT